MPSPQVMWPVKSHNLHYYLFFYVFNLQDLSEKNELVECEHLLLVVRLRRAAGLGFQLASLCLSTFLGFVASHRMSRLPPEKKGGKT